jgi:hypothetical protein
VEEVLKLGFRGGRVVAGFLANELGEWWRRRKAREKRLRDLYASWLWGMRDLVWTLGERVTPEGRVRARAQRLCEKRILMLERDDALRRSLERVRDSLPDYCSPEWESFPARGVDRDSEWRPFRESVDRLADALRRRRRW